MRRVRTRAERDATTVEMVFAAASGAVLAAVGFLAVASPVMAHQAHGTAREGWFTAAVIVAAALFCGRVAVTLRRFERRNRQREPLAGTDGPAGASQYATGPGAKSQYATGPAAESATGAGADPSGGAAVTSGQPSQPGRTRPDS
jgi:hypothetical protein